MVPANSYEGLLVNTFLNGVAYRVARRKTSVITVTSDPVIRDEPMIADKPVPPGQPPKPVKPVPDCTQWSYWVTRWEVKRMDTESVGIPVQTGTSTQVIQIPGAAPIVMEFPTYTTMWYLQVTITYGQTVQQFNGCGKPLGDKSWTSYEAKSVAMLSDPSNADRLAAGQITAGATAALAEAQRAVDRLTAGVNSNVMYEVDGIMHSLNTGIYNTMESGLAATQAQIAAAQRDFVAAQERYADQAAAYQSAQEKYSESLGIHQESVRDHQKWETEKAAYDELVSIKSDMIREDQVGSQYTVKGRTNLSVTVGQRMTGAEIIASGIQAMGGSGYNIDPNTTYIITSVDINTTRPRPPVPGINGITYPGVISVTRWLPREN